MEDDVDIKAECGEMGAISSLRDIKMRVLIISAVLACACAAPSVPFVAPFIPTLDPGDVEGAVTNAKVIAEDQAILAADKARELSEKAIEQQTDKLIENNDLIKEKQEEQFWSVEEKKWQTIDAIKTAEAKIGGAIAGNPEILTKSAYSVVVPSYIAPITPLVAPVGPITQFGPIIPAPVPYTPILYTPALKQADKAKDESEKDKTEPITDKTETKTEENMEKEKSEEDKVKSEALEKNLEEKPAVKLAPVYPAPLVPGVKLAEPWLTAPVYFPSQYSVQQVQSVNPLLTPTFIRTQW